MSREQGLLWVGPEHPELLKGKDVTFLLVQVWSQQKGAQLGPTGKGSVQGATGSEGYWK